MGLAKKVVATIGVLFIFFVAMFVTFPLMYFWIFPPMSSMEEAAEEIMKENQEWEKENMSRLSQGCIGGRDCIPSIDDPKFVTAEEAESDFLDDDDWVIGLDLNGIQRAYPLKILNWHEIVNDTVGDEYIAISFCPLCFTGNAFERVLDDEPVEFGVSGYLLNSNLVMYDRKTGSLWEQLTGDPLSAKYVKTRLKKITVSTLPWSDWKEQHPDTMVLSTDTGFDRDYQLFPYGDYSESARLMFEVENKDDRLFEKELVYGIRYGDHAKAYPLFALNERLPNGGELSDSIGRQKLRLTWDGGNFRVYQADDGKEIVPEIGFWFSWVAFYPETEIFER